MALGINDLDIYDDEFMKNETQKQDVTEEDQINEGESSKEQETTTNVVTELLKRQGIEDPNQISFEKEDGSIEKLKWDDLSLEEQLNILNQKPENDNLPPVNDEIGEDIRSLAKELKDNNIKFVLFHFPIQVWDCQHHGAIHLYGHVHSNKNTSHPMEYEIKNSYNVGADVNNYTPIELSEILSKLGR